MAGGGREGGVGGKRGRPRRWIEGGGRNQLSGPSARRPEGQPLETKGCQRRVQDGSQQTKAPQGAWSAEIGPELGLKSNPHGRFPQSNFPVAPRTPTPAISQTHRPAERSLPPGRSHRPVQGPPRAPGPPGALPRTPFRSHGPARPGSSKSVSQAPPERKAGPGCRADLNWRMEKAGRRQPRAKLVQVPSPGGRLFPGCRLHGPGIERPPRSRSRPGRRA